MFKPLNDRVLIEPDEVENTTSFGLILDKSKEKPSTGIVVVGNKEIKKGARVLFSKYGYDEAEIKGKLYYVVSVANILGIFE